MSTCLPGFADRDPSSLGIPSDTQYMQEYCQRAGIPPVDNWNFYMAFSFFRVAAILQGVYKRGLQGLWIRFTNKGVSPWHVTSLDLGRFRFMSCRVFSLTKCTVSSARCAEFRFTREKMILQKIKIVNVRK